MVKVRLEDVLYVEGAGNYILIHTPDEKHITYLTMKEIEHFLGYCGMLNHAVLCSLDQQLVSMNI